MVHNELGRMAIFVIAVHGKWKEEDQEFKVISVFCYLEFPEVSFDCIRLSPKEERKALFALLSF